MTLLLGLSRLAAAQSPGSVMCSCQFVAHLILASGCCSLYLHMLSTRLTPSWKEGALPQQEGPSLLMAKVLRIQWAPLCYIILALCCRLCTLACMKKDSGLSLGPYKEWDLRTQLFSCCSMQFLDLVLVLLPKKATTFFTCPG